MKKLDLYIIKKYLGTFVFLLGIIMSIAIVFDVSEKLDNFIREKAPLYNIIFHYYANFVLYYGNLLSGLFVFISVILFTGTLAQKSEIIAMLGSGISFKRILLPYLIGATIIVSLSLAMNHYILPFSNQVRLDFLDEYVEAPFYIKDEYMHREITPGVIVYFKKLDPARSYGTQFSIEKWEGDKMVYKMMGDRAHYDTLSNSWTINNYFERTFKGNKEEIKSGDKIKLDSVYNFKIADFGERTNRSETMNTVELNEFIRQKEASGSDKVPFYLIEKHQRTSYPFASYLLTVLGFSIASRKVRGGIGIHLVLGLLIAVIYIFFMKVFTVAATHAGFPPVVAVWLPNLIFLAITILIYKKAPK